MKLQKPKGTQDILPQESVKWQYVEEKAAFLSLISADPKALAEIPAERISLNSRNLNKVLSFYHTAIMNSSVTWCVAAVPTVLWAELLGYEGSDEEKINISGVYRMHPVRPLHQITSAD